MSAFCGFLNLDSAPADPQVVAAQIARLKHRGPDGSGAFTDGPMAMGHLLMRITPESDGETSPFRDAGGQLVIAFNGRLDHREDLLEALATPSHERDLPDPALILRAYEKWGEDCPVHLEGEFAFALWDQRRQELFCARDRFGSRDFYYHHGARRFTFASDIQGVLSAPGVPRELDEFSLGCRIIAVGEPPGRTLYRDIVVLSPTRTLTLKPGGQPVIRQYWQLTMEPELRLASPQDYAEGLRERMERAVRSALRTRHPVASMLSGGLDSTGVACLASLELAKRGQRLVTVSNVLPADYQGEGWKKEETPYIRATLEKHPTMVPEFAYGLMFPAIEFNDADLARHGVPIGDNHAFRTRELAMLAERHGARVLLGGLGGDMAASHAAAGLLPQLARSGRWLELARQLRLQSRVRRIPLGFLLKRELLRLLAPNMVRGWWDRRRDGPREPWQDTGINPAFAERLRLADYERESKVGVSEDLRRYRMALVNSGGGNIGGFRWLDFHSSALEGPQPLLDRRVWEFACHMPLLEFARDGLPRAPYRMAMRDLLPDQILQRTDKGWFGPDTRQRVAACRPQIEAFLDAHPPSHLIWEYFSLRDVRSAVERLGMSELPRQQKEYNAVRTVTVGALRLAHFVSWLRRSP